MEQLLEYRQHIITCTASINNIYFPLSTELKYRQPHFSTVTKLTRSSINSEKPFWVAGCNPVRYSL